MKNEQLAMIQASSGILTRPEAIRGSAALASFEVCGFSRQVRNIGEIDRAGPGATFGRSQKQFDPKLTLDGLTGQIRGLCKIR